MIDRHLKTRRTFSQENLEKILMVNVATYNDWTINFNAKTTELFNFSKEYVINLESNDEKVHGAWSPGFVVQFYMNKATWIKS